MIGSASILKSKKETFPLYSTTHQNNLRKSKNKSVYKSHLSYYNICSDSTLNEHHFNSKIVEAFYSTAEEKSIVSFYNLHHNSNYTPSNLSLLSGQMASHPVCSLGVLSKSTREIYYIDKFMPTSEVSPEVPQNLEEPNDSPPNPDQEPSQGPSSESVQTPSNREFTVLYREYIEKLEKKNPFKNNNTTGMTISPCGKKILVGYSDEHLKFWEVFKDSKSSKNDLSLALLSEWR